MRIEPQGVVKHCCLGVLGEISGCSINELSTNSTLKTIDMQEKCGIRSDDGCIGYNENYEPIMFKMRVGNQYKEFKTLAEANDGGASFKSIASWIEKNYKLL